MVEEFVLQKLLACERGLLSAYESRERTQGDGAVVDLGAALHRSHVEWLARALNQPAQSAVQSTPVMDEDWVRGDSFLDAEIASHDTWHDALLDLSPEVALLVRDRLIPDHHQLIRAWQALEHVEIDPSVTV